MVSYYRASSGIFLGVLKLPLPPLLLRLKLLILLWRCFMADGVGVYIVDGFCKIGWLAHR